MKTQNMKFVENKARVEIFVLKLQASLNVYCNFVIKNSKKFQDKINLFVHQYLLEMCPTIVY